MFLCKLHLLDFEKRNYNFNDLSSNNIRLSTIITLYIKREEDKVL